MREDEKTPWWRTYRLDAEVSEASQQIVERFPGVSVTEIHRLLPMKVSRPVLVASLYKGAQKEYLEREPYGEHLIRWWPAGTPTWVKKIRELQAPPLVESLLAEGPNASDDQIKGFLRFAIAHGYVEKEDL